MKTSLKITVAVAILAGAGLSGCAGDPYYGNPTYSQGYYQPDYSSGYHDPRYYAPSGYYDLRDSQRPFYSGRPSGYHYR